MQSILEKTIAWKFRTQAEYRNTTESLVCAGIERFTDSMEPIVYPIYQGLDKLFKWFG